MSRLRQGFTPSALLILKPLDLDWIHQWISWFPSFQRQRWEMDRNYFWHRSSRYFHTLNLSELSFSFYKIRRGKLHPKRLCITTVQGRRGWLQPGNVRATLTLPPIIILTAPTARKQCQSRESSSFCSWVLSNTSWLTCTGKYAERIALTGSSLSQVNLTFLMNKMAI